MAWVHVRIDYVSALLCDLTILGNDRNRTELGTDRRGDQHHGKSFTGHWPFPASFSCPPLLPPHTDFSFVFRFISSVLCLYTCVCIGLWTGVRGPQESKGVRFHGAGVTVGCDPLTWILGTELQSTQQALWSTDPSLSCFDFQWGIKCELVPPCSLGYQAPRSGHNDLASVFCPQFLWGFLNRLHTQSLLLLFTEPLPGWRFCEIQSTWI